MEVTQADFARLTGVSSAAISKKIANKTLIINSAGRLDTENPVNAAYMSRHRQRRAENSAIEQLKTGEKKSCSGATFNARKNSVDDYTLMEAAGLPAREMLNMTMREIVTKQPGIAAIERYARILKDCTLTAEREQRMAERALSLIPKDFVTARLFGFLSGLAARLAEYPEAAVDRIIALASAGSNTARIEIVETLTSGLAQIIGGAKDTIITELNGLKSKYQNDNTNQIDHIEEIKEMIEEARNG